MKKILLVLSLVFAAIAVNAQVYVGASLGYSSETKKDVNGDKQTSNSNFTFAPKIGYSLSDVFSVGLGFGVTGGSDKTFAPNGDELTNDKTSSWAIAPFARYTFAEFGKFSVLGEGTIFFAGAKDAAEIKSSEFGISVKPILAFEASDNISLEASLNFLNLGFSSKNENTEFDATTSNFNFGADSNNLMNTSSLQIGFIYKF